MWLPQGSSILAETQVSRIFLYGQDEIFLGAVHLLADMFKVLCKKAFVCSQILVSKPKCAMSECYAVNHSWTNCYLNALDSCEEQSTEFLGEIIKIKCILEIGIILKLMRISIALKSSKIVGKMEIAQLLELWRGNFLINKIINHAPSTILSVGHDLVAVCYIP